LNHPHICTLFDVGRDGDTDYLVMELIEGDARHQLAKGALPLAETLRTVAKRRRARSRPRRQCHAI
jgi:serine/threonine protein kinase